MRDGKTFLDLLVDQVMAARERYGVRLPLIFMDSFRTRQDTLAALVTHVLVHEVGHHFGLSDDDMHAIEASLDEPPHHH